MGESGTGEESQPPSSPMDDKECIDVGLLYATSFLCLLFLLTTIVLASALIVCFFRNRKRDRASIDRTGKGKTNPSYWISDYDLDNHKLSASTPNLSDWSSPQLSRPSRTFFSTLERVTEESGSTDSEQKSGLVPSKSMAPIAVDVRTVPKMRKSVSHNDLDQRSFSPKMVSKTIERRRPPSPPNKDIEPMSPTEDSPKSCSDNSPNTYSDDSPKSPSKESSSGDTYKPLTEERPTPLPRRKKEAVPSFLAKERHKSVDSDYDSLVPDYINVKRFVPATVPADPSPLYQELNARLLDKPAQYESLADFRKK